MPVDVVYGGEKRKKREPPSTAKSLPKGKRKWPPKKPSSDKSEIGQGRDREGKGRGRFGDRGLAVWLCPYCGINNPKLFIFGKARTAGQLSPEE